jgi:hypothetical protein
MNKNLKATVITIATATVLGGCASQTTTETGFGNAVREVTMKQTYDIGATLESEPEATVGADPYQLENVINTHRERSSQSRQTKSEPFVGSGNRR